ncbi:MAG: 50S ribosomal protein L21 [Acidobacteria bacterium]|nr:50S ribosomal protein L21 [Acidobacteriota bacterium]
MYAVIETGGKQYRVQPGDVVRVETLPGEAGSMVELDAKLVVSDSGLSTAPAKVRATITGHDRAPKVIVFKFKRKKQYKKTIGHRQNYTALRIEEIA